MKGSADVVLDEGNIVATKKVGDYFGEVGLAFDVPRTATLKAKSFCILARLERQTFKDVVSEAPMVEELIVSQIRQMHNIATTQDKSPGVAEWQARPELVETEPLLSEHNTLEV